MSKITIQRKDGIMYEKSQTYNTTHYDFAITFRYKLEQINKLKSIADRQGIKYQTLIKNILDDYIDKEL